MKKQLTLAEENVFSIDQWVKKRYKTPPIRETCFSEYYPVYGRVAKKDGISRIVSFRVAGFTVSPCINYLSPSVIEMKLTQGGEGCVDWKLTEGKKTVFSGTVLTSVGPGVNGHISHETLDRLRKLALDYARLLERAMKGI